MTVSITALLVSASVAYHSAFSERIKLTAAIENRRPDHNTSEGRAVDVDYYPAIMLINSGNRPVAVTNVKLVTLQTQKFSATAGDCAVEGLGLIEQDISYPEKGTFSPTVVPPLQIVAVQPNFLEQLRPSPMVFGSGEQPPQKLSDDVNIYSCLSFDVASPGRGVETITRELSRRTQAPDGSISWGESDLFGERAIELLDENLGLFD